MMPDNYEVHPVAIVGLEPDGFTQVMEQVDEDSSEIHAWSIYEHYPNRGLVYCIADVYDRDTAHKIAELLNKSLE